MNKLNITIIRYKEKNHNDDDCFGLEFSQDEIKLGDKNQIEKLISFKVELIANKIQLAIHPQFGNYEDVQIVKHWIQNEFSKDESQTLSDVILSISNKFNQQLKTNIRNQYLGLLTEISFIYFCVTKFKMDIFENWQIKQDLFDFHFLNNSNIEIKFLNKEYSTIFLSDRQLDWLNNEQENNQLVAIDLEWDSISGLNLDQLAIVLFQEMSKLKFKIDNNKKQTLFQKINDFKRIDLSLFETEKIKIESINPILIDKSLLPKIIFQNKDIKLSNILHSAIFKIIVSHFKDNNNHDMLKGFLCENK